jgi:hypothetical protein
MFITENYNPYDSLLFDMACRESLCILVDISDVKDKKSIKEYITKEAPSYEVLSLIIDGKLPEKEFTFENERLLFEKFKTSILINYNVLQPIIGESILQEVVRNVDTLSIINEAVPGQAAIGAPPPGLTSGIANTGLRTLTATAVGYTGRYAITKFLASPAVAGMDGLFSILGNALAGYGVGAIVALMGYASYKLYKNFLSKAAQACSEKSGAEKKLCMKDYEIRGLTAQMTDLRKGFTACLKTKNPDKCREALQKKIDKVKEKLDTARSNM